MLNARHLKAFLKSRLASFKVPKEYICLEELPKNNAGKLLKREIRKKYGPTGTCHVPLCHDQKKNDLTMAGPETLSMAGRFAFDKAAQMATIAGAVCPQDPRP